MKIKYSRDADVLIIKLREGKPSDSRDIAEGIIVHLTAKGQPLARDRDSRRLQGGPKKGHRGFTRRAFSVMR